MTIDKTVTPRQALFLRENRYPQYSSELVWWFDIRSRRWKLLPRTQFDGVPVDWKLIAAPDIGDVVIWVLKNGKELELPDI